MNELWIDADVLLRLLTGDPPPLAKKALALAKRAEAGAVRLRVATVVVAEVVWTLTSFYGYTRERVAEVLGPLLLAKGIMTEDEPQVIAAMGLMGSRDVDFLDAYLAQLSLARGGAVCSFAGDFDVLGAERVAPG